MSDFGKQRIERVLIRFKCRCLAADSDDSDAFDGITLPDSIDDSLMGHGSKEMIYEVYGKYVEGLEKDAGAIKDYFGKDFMGIMSNTPSTFAVALGESYSESRGENAVTT